MSYSSREFCRILRDCIRRLMLNDMMPEDVTRAISYYVHRVKEKTIPSLSVTIFLSVLLSDAITDMEFAVTSTVNYRSSHALLIQLS